MITYWVILISMSTVITSVIQFKNLDTNYDFIIVGSGSAGSVLANRLSENSEFRVLLLEVGKRPSIVNDIPAVAPVLQFTDYAWSYKMERTPGVCLGMSEQRCPWPRGRGLGGTTLINYMIYTRGHKSDYERWAALGNPGWDYEHVLPYFLKSEDSNLKDEDFGYHRHGGDLSVEHVPYRSQVADVFLKAAQQLGQSSYIDYNGRDQLGFAYVQANTKNGKRDSGYRAFIQKAERRPNLHVSTLSRVTRLMINKNTRTVYGVEFVKGRRYRYANASKEVIVCAGAFNSPQLLMLSGIGPRDQLSAHNIPLIQHLPGVGLNMHDHITFLGLIFTVNEDINVLETEFLKNPLKFLTDWWYRGQGPLTSLGGVEALGYINTNVSSFDDKYDENIPDMEFIMLSGQWNKDVADILRRSFGINDDIYRKLWSQLINKKVLVILPMHLKPRSIGHIELKSSNPYDWPRLYGNHLSDPENHDIQAFVNAIRFVQRLTSMPAFRAIGAHLIETPLPGCESLIFDSDEYWMCAVRHISTTLHHQVGTCKMGPKWDENAVVDDQLRVYGIKRLRVADTSIIPFALNAHTNAPTYMIGEKTADFIKDTWQKA